MAVRVLTDFHHSSLLRATNLLFGERLHMMVYRPIGLEWFDEGYWAINGQRDTANQFLSLDQAYTPRDKTPALNKITYERDELLNESEADGVYYVADPGDLSHHRACTLEFFKQNQFDYIIASIPAHVPLFEALRDEYQPNAKLIIQVGNNWDLSPYEGKNVLASTAPHFAPGVNVVFYHQEIEPIFKPLPTEPSKKIYSFVNILQNTGQGWADFTELEKLLPDFELRSYGGQCRDGNKNGPRELLAAMHEAELILHSKPGGDGFGHVIHSAYVSGRPVIARPSQYRNQLAEQLLVPGTFINLDNGRENAAKFIRQLTDSPDELFQMGKRAGERFREVVNYDKEAEEIRSWLSQL